MFPSNITLIFAIIFNVSIMLRYTLNISQKSLLLLRNHNSRNNNSDKNDRNDNTAINSRVISVIIVIIIVTHVIIVIVIITIRHNNTQKKWVFLVLKYQITNNINILLLSISINLYEIVYEQLF